MGNIAEKFPTQPADAKPPANGCLFMGGRSFGNQSEIDARIKDAQALGYTDIHEIDVPPCDPAKDYFHCQIVGGNPPYKYVWACPGQQSAQAPAPAASGAPAAASAPGAAPSAPIASSSTTALAVGGGIAAAGLLAFLALR